MIGENYIKALDKKIDKQAMEIVRLQQRINKAIEYIENNYYNSKLNIYASASSKEVKELLKILRGDKE